MTNPSPPAIAESAHAVAETAAVLGSLFEAKNSGSADRLLDCFSRSATSYSDATLGRRTQGWERYRETMRSLMPRWGDGRSYPLRIVGGPRSAVVLLRDTPELFGDEIRAIAAVDLDGEGKVTRWVDYWDSADFDRAILARLRTADDRWPDDFGAPGAEPAADVRQRYEAVDAATRDPARADGLFADDAVWEDMALKTRIDGARAIAAMLARLAAIAPYGAGARIRHVLGNEAGGGYEWIGRRGAGAEAGITMLEFDGDGRVRRATVTYDGGRLDAERYRALVLASVARTALPDG